MLARCVLYMDRLDKSNHSFSTERRNYWKSQDNNPDFDNNARNRMAKGLAPEGYVLHYPYGRAGHNWTIYEAITIEEHKAIHSMFGYGKGQGGYYQYIELFNFLRIIFNIF